MNAGAWGKEFASLVKEVMVMDYKGRVIKLTRNKIRFGYRYSNLSKYIVLSVTIILGKKSQRGILNNIKLNISKRIARQDLSLPSAGCIFKNPSGHSAGRLIDLCGLKGRRSGGAIISAKHANFILNYHKASASDVLALMNTVKKEVRRKFGINLCPEVKIWR
jgi:UDP-N-acetylmuramate dehydrogenase